MSFRVSGVCGSRERGYPFIPIFTRQAISICSHRRQCNFACVNTSESQSRSRWNLLMDYLREADRPTLTMRSRLNNSATTHQLRILATPEWEAYSVRRACSGSMREASRAGTYAATRATAQRSRLTPVSTHGLVGVIPKSRDVIDLLIANDPRIPNPAPATASHSVLARTARRTNHGLAPKATRIQFSSATGHITRATASVIFFHCDSSNRSFFLPFSVSR